MRRYVPARDGDKVQARTRINHMVRGGYLPEIHTQVCVDCSVQAETYDHHLGYAAEHHEHVQPVCLRCHAQREIARGVKRYQNPVSAEACKICGQDKRPYTHQRCPTCHSYWYRTGKERPERLWRAAH